MLLDSDKLKLKKQTSVEFRGWTQRVKVPKWVLHLVAARLMLFNSQRIKKVLQYHS